MRTSAGSSPAGMLTLMPIPSTTRPSADSPRIPATLWPPIRTSLGCFNVGSSPVTVRIASAQASAPTTVSSGNRAASTCGRSCTEQRTLVPGAASQRRPRRPRPSVCSSATATAPSGPSKGSSRWVDGDLSTYVYSRPKRPLRRGTTASRVGVSFTDNYTNAAVQPSLRKRRQIPQTPRSERPLVYERLSDAILVKRAKDGDKRALEALCERHAPKVERLAGHLLADPEDARDASQEALAKLCVRIGQFRGESQFSTWLHRLVVNTCRDVAARQRVRRCEPLHEDERVADDADPAREAGLAELRSELAGGLAGISPEQAKVVVLKDALDFSFAEIAEAVDMPVGTAKCYAHRARAGLRTRLKRDVA